MNETPQPRFGHFGELNTELIDVQLSPSFNLNNLISFIGPAFFVSVGYLDPGNWATDIEGGSRFGYSLLWVLLLSNIFALLLQTLAAKLGIVTSKDLAQMCREEYPLPICWILWFLCEIAIAATDLAEVLGTAIGLKLLLSIPLIMGVLLTAFDTFIFLVVQRYGIRKLEGLIFMLLSIISSCFIVEFILCKPSMTLIVEGFVPTIGDESLYVAVSMLGATVMPHNFYLHSSMVQSRRIDRNSPHVVQQAVRYSFYDCAIALNVAFFVNSAILIVSATVFWTNDYEVKQLEDAHNLLETLLDSKLAPIAFGLGLFCAGQSSTLTGTLAGQIVMEGFLELRMTPWIRRFITRVVAILPAVIVIGIVGDQGTYQLLILSQVILSLQLPFAIIPLITFTSNPKLMGYFTNSNLISFLSWISAAIIISINIWMVAATLYDLVSVSYPVRMITYSLLLPISISLCVLLFWLLYHSYQTITKNRNLPIPSPPQSSLPDLMLSEPLSDLDEE